MANQEHLDILKQGVETWNQWRQEHADIRPDLSEAHLSRVELPSANLSRADLRKATLSRANLSMVDLHNANLTQIDLDGANLRNAKFVLADLNMAKLIQANLDSAELPGASLIRSNLRGANLCRSILVGADLTGTNLKGADLREANLCRATFVGTNLRGANLTDCSIFGISAWEVQLEGAIQDNLVITHSKEPTITVDNLKIAQFLYLLLNNEEIRDAIDTIARKAVLILGRFIPPRKAILEALREALRTHGYVPILFDFDKPASRDLTETVSTLAHLARFIIVDLTDPSSAPHEVATVIPQTVVPVQPLILGGEREYSMFHDLSQRYHWVLPTYSYTDQAHLLATLKEHVIAPAEQKAQELTKR